jgi:cytochrome P450
VTESAQALAELVYDPYSYETDVDPYPLYRRMRDEAPVYHNAVLDFYALTRFQDCLDALLDWETYSSAHGTVLELMGPEPLGGSMMIFMDPPRQTRYRNLVNKAFTKARIARLEPAIRELAAAHLDRLMGRPSFDAVKEFTARLPMDVISTLLGIPAEDRDRVRGWSNDILHREPGNPNIPARGIEGMMQSQAYYQAALDERRARPRDDLMSALIEAEIEDDDGSRAQLTDEDLRSFFMLLATAGNETVTKLLATALYWLPRFPEQRQALLGEPQLLPGAVEEFLRFDPPSHYQGRTLERDVTLHGVRMPEGARVMIVNGASGRDERRFADPDRLDVRRELDVQLGFGFGRHLCLGASLARMEMKIGLEEFLRRFPDYEAPQDGVERIHSSNVRGLGGLRIEV